MAFIVCFKCGCEKIKPLTACGQCGAIPKTYGEKSVSLVLSIYISTKGQVDQFASEIRNGLRITASEDQYVKSREMMKNPHLMGKHGEGEVNDHAPNATSSPSQTAALSLVNRKISLKTASSPYQPAPSMNQTQSVVTNIPSSQKITALHENPFFLLGATVHDDRQRIDELAEEKSLIHDSDIYTKAGGDLTKLRNRLAIEMAWLPGVPPDQVPVVLGSLNDYYLKNVKKYPPLAHANLLADTVTLLSPTLPLAFWIELIVDFATIVDRIDLAKVLSQINKDRSVANFPEVRGIDQIEEEFAVRCRFFNKILQNILDSFSTKQLVVLLTKVVELATDTGKKHAPLLIDELVDYYEINANNFLQREAENLKKLIKSIEDAAASRNKNAVNPLIEQLKKTVKKWDFVAQPIQLSMKARGINHKLSHEIASSVRDLSIKLFNEHDMLDITTSLTKISQELFAELPEVVARLDEDAEALADIYNKRKVEAQLSLQWDQASTCQNEIELLIQSINKVAPQNNKAKVEPLVNQLERMLRKWVVIVKPIQVSMRAHDLDDDVSPKVALSIRGLAIDLFNKYDMLDMATRLTKLLQEIFAELPEVVERLDADAEALEDIYIERKVSTQQDVQRAREITYQAEIGLVFKDTLKISPDGVEWKGQRFPLDSITRVRWGAVRKSVNGIPTGTDYTIAIGDHKSETVINTNRGEVYNTFTDRLWKAACVRLVGEILESFKKGETISFGGVVVDDLGVTLRKHKLISSDPVYRRWGAVNYCSYNGCLTITDREDKKTYANISYLHTANTHILETILRLSFKKWTGRLSGFLE